MHKYNVRLNYVATFEVTVEAEDEGQAYDKARDLSENADMNQYMLTSERESICNCIE